MEYRGGNPVGVGLRLIDAPLISEVSFEISILGCGGQDLSDAESV